MINLDKEGRELIRNLIAWAFIVLVQIHAVLSLWRIVTTGAPDFSVFYDAARAAISGQSLYINAPFFTAFGYPPVTALVFLPLLMFPLWTSQAIWVVGSYVFLFAVVWVCLRMLGHKPTVRRVLLIGSLFFLSFPTKFTLGMGQSNLVALFMLLWITRLLQAGRHATGSVWYAILLALKPHMGIHVLFFLARKEWRFLLFSASSLIIVTGISVVIFGTGQYVDYFTQLAPGLAEYKGREIYYNQGLGALFARLLEPPADQILTMTGLIVVVAVSTLRIFQRQREALYCVSVLLVSLVLVEPLAWQHHLIFVFPGVLWLWCRTKGNARLFSIVGFVLISLNIKQPEYFGNDALSQLILSHGSVGLLLLYIVLVSAPLSKAAVR